MVSTRNRLPPSPSHGRGAKSHGYLPKTQERRGRERAKKAEAIRGPAESQFGQTSSLAIEFLEAEVWPSLDPGFRTGKRVAEPPRRYLVETAILTSSSFSHPYPYSVHLPPQVARLLPGLLQKPFCASLLESPNSIKCNT